MAASRLILWDVGGVLLTNGWDHAERAEVLRHFALDRAEYDARHDAANDAWEKGLITAEEFLARTVFFRPRPFQPAEFLEKMKAQSQLLEGGAMRILRKLAASGEYRLAALNNEARELNEYRFERFGLRALFDAFLSSCYVHLRKPDPKIYQLALDALDRGGAQVVFVDDREENCAAAERLGIHAIRFRDEAQLAKELKCVGISC